MKSHNEIEKVEAYRIYDKYFETESEAVEYLDQIDSQWVVVCLEELKCERYADDDSNIFVLKLTSNCVFEFKQHIEHFHRIRGKFIGFPDVVNFDIDFLKTEFTKNKVLDILQEVLNKKKNNLMTGVDVYNSVKDRLCNIRLGNF